MRLLPTDLRETLADLAAVCGPGSVLAADFWHRVVGAGPVDRFRRAGVASLRLVGEPIRFLPSPAQAGRLLAEAGFVLTATADGARMTSRFVTGERRCDPGSSVFVAKIK